MEADCNLIALDFRAKKNERGLLLVIVHNEDSWLAAVAVIGSVI